MVRSSILPFLVAGLAGLGVTYAGLAQDPALTARCVPVNYMLWRVTFPNGHVMEFQRDSEDPNLVIGDVPWQGKIEGDRLMVMTPPDVPGGQRGLLFKGGHLLLSLGSDGQKSYALRAFPATADSIASLWPTEQDRQVEKKSSKYDIWLGSEQTGGRRRFGFVNPNVAGLVFSQLALVSLGLLFFRPWWVRGLSVVGAGLSLFCLAATQSRGALLAFATGAALMAGVWLVRRCTWRKVVVLVLCLLAVGTGLWFGGYAERARTGIFNEGYEQLSRLPIWREVPRMLADAPWGWGWGRSGVAYIDWYQPLDRFHVVRTLMNSHLTWMTEGGWLFSVGYVFAWLCVLLLLAVRIRRGGNPMPLAVFVALAIAASFNPVASNPFVWVVPAVTAFGLFGRNGNCCWRSVWRPMGVALVLALLTVGLLVVGGALSSRGRMKICGSPSAMRVAGTSPDVWVVDDEYALHHDYWGVLGKEIRIFYREHPTAKPLGIVTDFHKVPREVTRLVLIGRAAERYVEEWTRDPSSVCSAGTVTFLSPSFKAVNIPKAIRERQPFEVIVGELAACREGGLADVPEWVRVVPGAELYIPDWLKYVTCR